VIVVTKCPADLPVDSMKQAVEEIGHYAPGAEVYFSTVSYGAPIAHSGNPLTAQERVLLVTGIARADGLKKYADEQYALTDHLEFADHHRFTTRDVQIIERMAAENNAAVLTTEKDYMRLKSPEFADLWKGTALHYLPIQMTLLKDGATFDQQVKKVFE
jgi:tetraacyldisaccharide 4'-kinase